MGAKFTYTLFISGDTPRARAAEVAVRALCALEANPELTVVDVLTHRESARVANILLTPTLVKTSAEGDEQRAVGAFTDARALFSALNFGATRSTS